MIEKIMVSFEKKTLRIICGPVYNKTLGRRRRRKAKEIREMVGVLKITHIAKASKIQRFGYATRRPESANPLSRQLSGDQLERDLQNVRRIDGSGWDQTSPNRNIRCSEFGGENAQSRSVECWWHILFMWCQRKNEQNEILYKCIKCIRLTAAIGEKNRYNW